MLTWYFPVLPLWENVYEMFVLFFTENLIAWISRRPRRKRAKSRRISAKENKRKSMKAVTAQVTPPVAAAAALVAQIWTAMPSSRAKREIRTRRKKNPAGITAQRVRDVSRVRKRPPLTGAGHQALALDRSSLKRSPEIIDKQGQRGEGAGVENAAQRIRQSWREVERERDPTAGTERDLAAPNLAWTEVGAAREAGRTEVKIGITVEMLRGTQVAQMEGKEEQQMGGVEAGKERKNGWAEGEAQVGVREERVAMTEQRESTKCCFSLLQCWTKSIQILFASIFLVTPPFKSEMAGNVCDFPFSSRRGRQWTKNIKL